MTSSFFLALQASVGNLSVTTTREKQYEIFKVLDLASFWIYGFCTFCFAMLFQDFMALWIGLDYVLSDQLVWISCFSFYLTGVLYPIWCYRETAGLFKHTRYVLYYASILNVLFSLLFGKLFGIEGVLFATIIARCFTNIWYEPYKLFHEIFDKRVRKYYASKIFQTIIILFDVLISKWVVCNLHIEELRKRFLVEMLLCGFVPVISFFLYSFKKEEYLYIVRSVFGKRRDGI